MDSFSNSEDIIIGKTQYKVTESQGKITFFNVDKKEGIDLFGNFDSTAVKKDLAERFKKSSLTVYPDDIGRHISKQKCSGSTLYKDVSQSWELQLKHAEKAGFVQGVCECVALVGNDQNLSKKLLSEMQVTKDMAQKYANPVTYKILEQSVFAPKVEQKLEQTMSFKR